MARARRLSRACERFHELCRMSGSSKFPGGKTTRSDSSGRSHCAPGLRPQIVSPTHQGLPGRRAAAYPNRVLASQAIGSTARVFGKGSAGFPCQMSHISACPGRSGYYPQSMRNRPEPDAFVFAHVLAVDLERYWPGRPERQRGLVVQGEHILAARRAVAAGEHLAQRGRVLTVRRRRSAKRSRPGVETGRRAGVDRAAGPDRSRAWYWRRCRGTAGPTGGLAVALQQSARDGAGR